MRFLCLTLLALWMLPVCAFAQGTTEVKLFKLENRDAQELLSVAEQMVSPDGSASVDTRTNTIIANGTSTQLEQLGQLLAELDQALKQVSLTVYVAEINTAMEKRFGLDISRQTVLPRSEFDAALELIDSGQGGRIEQFMEATTMSGDPAYLQVSSDQFVTLGQQEDAWGNPETIYARVPVGEFLQVLPRVKPESGDIDVMLTPVVSRSGGKDDIIVRGAATRITVPDGGTVAIGGSSTTSGSNGKQGIPLIPLEKSRQSGGQRVMIFLSATTESGTNLLPAPPGQMKNYDDPEVVVPGRQMQNRDMHGSKAK
ncbi:secretin N-terminal domain-containing protein [Ruficoccus sp. ZRK36]|uniref:type II secretion system protein GspD n=1 Tax=Ruficoccus sp. ZRK36 TaxID=2866311 RepID=UPI001C730D32|nr:secretin N-terminal domain-containing protein [Ruficoccus sp. ZRK36]QYY36778.1 hypothetical protein K0V07_04700 [Ruficoccus sp. ZRK36]